VFILYFHDIHDGQVRDGLARGRQICRHTHLRDGQSSQVSNRMSEASCNRNAPFHERQVSFRLRVSFHRQASSRQVSSRQASS